MYIDYDAEDFLFWSMYMANKYDYAPAYYDVYQTFGRALDLKEPYPKKELGENNYKLALEYLNIAARKNFLPAKNTLEKYNK
jgi:hypothetical protein